MIENGQYAGQTLDQVWNEHRELFGDFPSKDFPLLCKIVDARHLYLFTFILTTRMHMNLKTVNMVSQNVGILLMQKKMLKLYSVPLLIQKKHLRIR